MIQACDDANLMMSESSILSVALYAEAGEPLRRLFAGSEAGLYRAIQGGQRFRLATTLAEGISFHNMRSSQA